MVPEGWSEGRVGDLIEALESGVSVNGEDRDFEPGEKGVLKVSAVSYGFFDPFAAKVIEGEELSRAKTNPKCGQIIISRSNTEELVGASAYVDRDYPNLFLPDKLWQTVPGPHADMKWLSYVLASGRSRYTLSKLATGTSGSMKNITKDELLTLKILIPPSLEQKKIAQILSTWDKAITTTEQLLVNSQQQKKALMQQLLTGKKRLLDKNGDRFSGEWKLRSVRDVSLCITKGTTPSTNGFEFKESGIPFVKVESIREDGSIDKAKLAYIDEECHQAFKRSQLQPGDILFSIAGALGRVALVPAWLVTANTNQAVCLIRLQQGCLDQSFAYFILQSPKIRRDIAAETAQAAQPNLSLKNVGDFKIPVPAMEEQQKIAAVLSTADQEISALQQKLDALKQEKKALMQQLLTGKRRVRV